MARWLKMAFMWLLAIVALASAPACSRPNAFDPLPQDKAGMVNPPIEVQDDYVTPSDLIHWINLGNVDKTLEALNDVKAMRHRADVLDTIEALWVAPDGVNGITKPDVARNVYVRIELADVLLQEQKNHERRAPEDIEEFLHQAVMSSDSYLASSAVIALGLIDTEENAQIIGAAGRRGPKDLFRMSVIALSGMCVERAKAELGLIEQTADEERRDYMRDVISKSADLQSAGWCQAK